MATFVEGGEDALDVGVDFGGRVLGRAGKVALGHVAGRGAGYERAGQGLPSHVFVVGATVNVYDIAGAILHLLHSFCSDQLALVSGMRGASRSVGRVSLVVAKWVVAVATGGSRG